MDTSDTLRVAAIVIGGCSFGIGLVVAREWIMRLDGFGRLAAQVFIAVHLLVVLFITGTLVDRVGDPISWYTPTALVIFTSKIICLELVRQLQHDQYLRQEPPQRRATDKP